MAEATSTPTTDARALADYLRSEEGSTIVRQVLREEGRNYLREAVSDFTTPQKTPVAYPEEAIGLIRLLAARSGDTREDVLLKALTLYGLALDAIEKGNSLAILNPDDEIVREITGFESSEAADRPVAR